jgi:hypothetical protein
LPISISTVFINRNYELPRPLCDQCDSSRLILQNIFVVLFAKFKAVTGGGAGAIVMVVYCISIWNCKCSFWKYKCSIYCRSEISISQVKFFVTLVEASWHQQFSRFLTTIRVSSKSTRPRTTWAMNLVLDVIIETLFKRHILSRLCNI